MKQWKCTVCGYIHDGDQPPDTCPVCGADKSKFIEIGSPNLDTKTTKTVSGSAVRHDEGKKGNGFSTNLLFQLILKHHAHPVSVHIPNGVLPVSVIFLFIAVLFSAPTFGSAAFYNLVFVALAMPFVVFSGLIEWKMKYRGALTLPFIIKITCGIIVTILSWTMVIWLFINSNTIFSYQTKWILILIGLVMLAAAGLAGFFGGKLVFKEIQEN